MAAVLVDIAAAITTEMASVSLSETATIQRSYADWDDLLTDFDNLRVDVVPASCPTEQFTRGKLRYSCTVNVLLRKRFSQTDRTSATGRLTNSSVDALVNDLQTIHEYFAPSQPNQDGRKLTDQPSANWLPESGIRQPYSRPMLREHDQFSGWVSLVYAVYRSFA